jgi:signal transduction histidine kinase
MTRMSGRGRIGGLSITAALAVGFALTLTLWLFTGYDFASRIAEAERDAALITQRYMRAQEALVTIRSEVLLGSVYVRDALLDPDPLAPDSYRLRLKDTYAAVDVALRRYEPILGTPGERRRVERLRREVDDFQTTMLDVLRTDRSRWRIEARRLLNETVVPRRASLIGVADESQALNRAAFIAQQRALAATHQGLQDRVWQRLAFGLVISFAIALIAVTYSGRLERRLRLQQVKDAQNTRDLERLSTQLIRAQEEERRTVARELHDEVGQAFLAVKVELACARRAMAARGGSDHLLDEAESITDAGLRVVRDLSQLLHPALLDDLGLVAAVDWHIQGFRKRHGLDVELRADAHGQRLPTPIEATAFRIIQEGLTNVAKHASATTCIVGLRRAGDRLVVTIDDDGLGFDTTEPDRTGAQRGLGLVGMRERVAQLHGTFTLLSGRDTGTRLIVELPVAVPNEAPSVLEKAHG